MRLFRFHILVSLLVGVLLTCLANGASAARARDDKILNDALQKKLDRIVTVQFDEMPLSEVVDFFRTECEINIVYDPPENEDVEKIVNLNVNKMKAQTVLRWVTKLTALDSEVVGGVLYISTRDRVDEMRIMFMRQYDVRDLLATPQSLRAGRNDNNNNDDDGNENDDDNSSNGSPAEDLMQLLVLFTGPSNWDHVEVLGITSWNDDTESESREDNF